MHGGGLGVSRTVVHGECKGLLCVRMGTNAISYMAMEFEERSQTVARGVSWYCVVRPISTPAQVAARSVTILSSLFLSEWSAQSEKPVPDHSVGYYLGVFGAISLAAALVSAVGNLCICFAAVGSAERLHHKMLDCIVRCPMSFYDTTPLGRIINRFSNDVATVDMQLPDYLNQSFQVRHVSARPTGGACPLAPAARSLSNCPRNGGV